MDEKILTEKITFFNEELGKISQFLSDITARTNLLFTIAGLLSFLPPLAITNSNYLPYFLTWSLHFLLVALVAYFPASLRVQSVVKRPVHESVETQIKLEVRSAYLEKIWQITVDNYDRVLIWNKITCAMIYAYIFSLVSIFYAFVFFGEPKLCASIILLAISYVVAIAVYVLPALKSEKNKTIHAPL